MIITITIVVGILSLFSVLLIVARLKQIDNDKKLFLGCSELYTLQSKVKVKHNEN